MGREKSFENKIKDYFKSQGYWHVKYWAGAQYTKEGIPDILACVHGVFFGIEVKAQNGRPTLVQLVNLRNIRRADGIGVLLYPQDWLGFKDLVDSGKVNSWYAGNIELQNQWFKKLNI